MAAFFGGALMAVGALIAALSGLCTGVVIIGSVIAAFQNGRSDSSGLAGLALIFGGAPFAVGLLLFFIGRGIYRSGNRQAAQPPVDGPTPPP